MKSKPRKNRLSPALEGRLGTGKPVRNAAVKLMREDGRALIMEVKAQRTGVPRQAGRRGNQPRWQRSLFPEFEPSWEGQREALLTV